MNWGLRGKPRWFVAGLDALAAVQLVVVALTGQSGTGSPLLLPRWKNRNPD